jgi:hypothetical protein
MSYSYQSKRQDFAKHIRSEQKQNIFERERKKMLEAESHHDFEMAREL